MEYGLGMQTLNQGSIRAWNWTTQSASIQKRTLIPLYANITALQRLAPIDGVAFPEPLTLTSIIWSAS